MSGRPRKKRSTRTTESKTESRRKGPAAKAPVSFFRIGFPRLFQIWGCEPRCARFRAFTHNVIFNVKVNVLGNVNVKVNVNVNVNVKVKVNVNGNGNVKVFPRIVLGFFGFCLRYAVIIPGFPGPSALRAVLALLLLKADGLFKRRCDETEDRVQKRGKLRGLVSEAEVGHRVVYPEPLGVRQIPDGLIIARQPAEAGGFRSVHRMALPLHKI